MADRTTKLQLVEGMDGEWRSRIKAPNGEITLVGEGYRVRHDGLRQLAKNLARLGHRLAGKTAGEIQGMIEVLPRDEL